MNPEPPLPEPVAPPRPPVEPPPPVINPLASLDESRGWATGPRPFRFRRGRTGRSGKKISAK